MSESSVLYDLESINGIDGFDPKDAVRICAEARDALMAARTEAMGASQECDRLRAALRRAHGIIRKCVTAGVLRHDLNQFLANEAEYRGPPESEEASR